MHGETWGFDEYPDERDAMGAIGDVGNGAVLTYVPSTAPVGSGAAYFPGDVSADARALNYLGWLPDSVYQSLKTSTGSQQGDMNGQAGAWDPAFQVAVKDFQSDNGDTVDGWIGPQTRATLGQKVAAKNGGAVIPVTPPATPNAPNAPGETPGMPMAEKLGIAAAVAGVGAALWWYFKK